MNILTFVNDIVRVLNTVCLKIKVNKGFENFIPEKAHNTDAGFDLKAALTEPLAIPPGECILVPVGFKCSIPEGYELQVRPRSGLALKNYISVLNTPGTVDCHYRGDVGVILFNFGKYPFIVEPGMRIAQGVVCKLPSVNIVPVDELDTTDRGEGGFGSTGKS